MADLTAVTHKSYDGPVCKFCGAVMTCLSCSELGAQRYVDDGFGNEWGPCSDCGSRLDVVRPGKATCSVCETRRVFDEVLAERNKLRAELAKMRAQSESTEKPK